MENKAFSLWCDFIERDFLEKDFTNLVKNECICGATSNPSIFQQAFLGEAYKEQKDSLKGKSAKEIYEALAIRDIKRAAEIFLPMYEKNTNDGYVSLEIDPFLCDDASESIKEGIRLFKSIGYPNVMIKVPATNDGFKVMEELISQGISVNATLIFTKEQTIACMDAFSRGYESFKEVTKKEVEDYPRAVVSIFVSRFDRKCDAFFKEKNAPTALLGIRNAQYLYTLINDYSLPGVRALFASTGVKGDELKPSYYVEELYHSNVVNTAPLKTIEAFLQVENPQEAYLPNKEELEDYFKMVGDLGLDLKAVSKELLEQGLSDFKIAFQKILESLA